MDLRNLFSCCDDDDAKDVVKMLSEAEKSFNTVAKDVELFVEYRGFKIVPNFSVSSIDYALTQWFPRKGDVFVASFPKTGTNWTVEIVRHLLYPDPHLFNLVKGLPLSLQFLEAGNNCEKFQLLDKISPQHRRLIFTHLPSDLFNVEGAKKAGAKVVYVLRNPKDQIVSWYHFYRSLPKAQNEPLKSMIFSGWDTFFDNYVNARFCLYNKPGEWYPEHILSWLRHRDDTFVYFLFYEDLQQNLAEEIEKLAKFIDVSLQTDEIKKVAEKCCLNSMKMDIRENPNGQLAQAQSIILRQGQVGGWREYFSEEQSRIVDKIFASKLKDSNIQFVERL